MFVEYLIFIRCFSFASGAVVSGRPFGGRLLSELIWCLSLPASYNKIKCSISVAVKKCSSKTKCPICHGIFDAAVPCSTDKKSVLLSR